jgi:hypothetical protein
MQLVPAIFPDRMPRWLPAARLTASWNPDLFMLKNWSFAFAGAAGLLLVGAETLRRFSSLG